MIQITHNPAFRSPSWNISCPGRCAGLIALLLASVMCLRGAVPLPVINTNYVIVVTNSAYGAVGDGVHTNTTAIQNAINQATTGGTTNSLTGGTVEIPPGTFLCGPLTFKSNVNLQIDAGAVLRMLPFGQYPVTWYTNGGTNIYFVATANFISGSSLTNIEISGAGAIDGQGTPWWPWANTNGASRPIMISLTGCNVELIQNVTLSNSPMFHIAIGGSSGNTTVQYVTERANSSSDPTNPGHNTDACDVSGTNTVVQFNNISVGDDNFTCGGKTSGVTISNNVYGSGHGVSIGSYTSPSVSNLTVINCTFTNTDAGLRIKTDRDRGGLVHNISYANLTMTNVMHPILIYTEYTNAISQYRALDSISPGVAASYPAAVVTATTPYYRDITISNVTGNAQSGRAAGLIWGLPESCVSNVTLVNVHLAGSTTFGIYHAKNVRIIDSSHSVPAGVSQFSFFDSDVTFSNSIPATNAVTLDGVTTNTTANAFAFYNAAMTLSHTNALALNSTVTLGASTLTVSNSLMLTASNSFNFQLGTNAATVAVKGNLTLGGTNNIYAGNGFTNGTYTLFTYTGVLGGSLPVLGAVPGGFVCNLTTNTAGQVNLIATPPAPAAPANLTAAGTNLAIRLSWSAAANATGYNLKRSTTNGGSYALIGSLNATNSTDTAVSLGVMYYYVVTATNSAGESANSIQAGAAPSPSLAPTSLTCQHITNRLTLAWPADHLGWHLESQTNKLGAGLGTNWLPVAASSGTNQMTLPVVPTNGSVFYRLTYP